MLITQKHIPQEREFNKILASCAERQNIAAPETLSLHADLKHISANRTS